MQLDPKLKEILDGLDPTDEEPVEEMDPVRARAIWKEEMAAVAGTPLPVKAVSERAVPGPGGPLTMRLYEPDGAGAGPLPILVYYHGGGWIRGDLDTHDDVCRYLCHHAGCLVASIDYRLSPEHQFPDPLEDCYAATRWIATNTTSLNADPARMAIGGDSAGGNFACGVSLMARDQDGPKITFQLLIYPVTDLASETESKRLYSSGYLLNSMPFYIASYIGGADRTAPLASPLRAPDHSGLPPAFVLTAGFDPLRDEGDAYAERLRAAGVPTEHRCYESMIHGFVSITGLIESAEAGLADSAAALRAAFAQ
jgi:acetyl esterase